MCKANGISLFPKSDVIFLTRPYSAGWGWVVGGVEINFNLSVYAIIVV